MIFGSDNQSGASPKILKAINEANDGFTHGYGDDEWTKKAVEGLRSAFDCDLDAYFVSTGTVANCLALACLARPWETIICGSNAHILMDESTAPEFFTGGARMKPLGKGESKLETRHIMEHISVAGKDLPHNSQPGVVSITQSNEIGQVYSPVEIKELSEVCKEHNLKFHMDGARFANALVSQGCTPAEMTWRAGVDVLCLGATKSGAICAEAVLFFNKALSKDFEHLRKRAGQLVSKGRLFGSQFAGWLDENHWLELAGHANSQATKLSNVLSEQEKVEVVWPVSANQIFAVLPKSIADQLIEMGAEFYDWYPEALPSGRKLRKDESFIRLVTSFRTSDDDITRFSEKLNQLQA